MSAMFKSWIALGVFGAALASAGCGDLATQGRSPVQLQIMALEAASGATPDEFGASLHSDVLTNVDRTVDGEQVTVATIFNDNGCRGVRARDEGPGVACVAEPRSTR